MEHKWEQTPRSSLPSVLESSRFTKSGALSQAKPGHPKQIIPSDFESKRKFLWAINGNLTRAMARGQKDLWISPSAVQELRGSSDPWVILFTSTELPASAPLFWGSKSTRKNWWGFCHLKSLLGKTKPHLKIPTHHRDAHSGIWHLLKH